MQNILRSPLSVLMLIIEACWSYAAAGSPDSLSASSQKSALQLDFIRSTGVAYLLPLSGSKRVRFGLDVNVRTNDGTNRGKNSSVIVYPDTTILQQSSSSSSSYSFSGDGTFSVVYIVDLLNFKSGAIYGGIGPSITYSRSYSNSISPYPRDTLYGENRGSSGSYGWTYGARAVLGIQARVTTSIDIHAEYILSPGYQETYSNNVSTVNESGLNGYRRSSLSKNESWSKRRTWGITGLNAGIIFYF